MCHANNEKQETQHLMDIMELLNQEKIRTLGEKESYKYLEILEADTIKQMEMKKKLKKSVLGEQESYSKQNYIAGNWISSNTSTKQHHKD